MFTPNPTGTTITGQQRYLIAYFALVLASAGVAALVVVVFGGRRLSRRPSVDTSTVLDPRVQLAGAVTP